MIKRYWRERLSAEVATLDPARAIAIPPVGAIEASMMLHIRPDLVDMNKAERLEAERGRLPVKRAAEGLVELLIGMDRLSPNWLTAREMTNDGRTGA
jgi:creatinine amidohydrolase/Fe(II)-dependent formamide hydrolase-like protein